jgi:hypothetical protein
MLPLQMSVKLSGIDLWATRLLYLLDSQVLLPVGVKTFVVITPVFASGPLWCTIHLAGGTL